MNTLNEAVDERTKRATPAVQPAAAGIRIVGAAVAVAILVHLVTLFAPGVPLGRNSSLVTWTAIAFPLGQLALAWVMWRTRAASRALLAVGALAFAALAVTSTMAAIGGDGQLFDDVEGWIVLVGLVAAYLTALHVLARGAWRGVLRWLPMVGASWGLVVTVVVVQFENGSAWWGLILTLTGGLALLGAALAVSPQLALPAEDGE